MPKLPGVYHLDAVRAPDKAGFHVLRHVRWFTVNWNSPAWAQVRDRYTMSGLRGVLP
jgi:hypothetical protein